MDYEVETLDGYRRMDAAGLIHDYLIPCYDTLHTESRDNVTADVIETLQFWEANKRKTVAG